MKSLTSLILIVAIISLFAVPAFSNAQPTEPVDPDPKRAAARAADVEANTQFYQGAAASVEQKAKIVQDNPIDSDPAGCGYKYLPTGSSLACWILYMINEIIDFLAFIPQWVIPSLFTVAITLNAADTIVSNPGVQLGWSITRDFANLFFIIILIAIALGTIFDVGQFNKKLIGKVILVAITINFSLALLQFVVSQANNVALFFMNQVSVIHKANGGRGDFTAAIRDIVNLDQAIKAVTGQLKEGLKTGEGGSAAKEELLKSTVSVPRVQSFGHSLEGFPQDPENPNNVLFPVKECQNKNSPYWGKGPCLNTAKLAAEASRGLPLFSKLALQIMVKIIVIPVGLFILLAASFMLIGRILWLSILGVFAPLAFFSMIIPGYNQFGTWWKKVLNQALFFPAFMFMFMISLILFQQLNSALLDFKETMISYFIGLTLMGMSLTVAQSMGAQGASAIIKWGHTAKNSVANYAKAQAKNRALQGVGAVAGKGLEVMADARLLNSKFGRIPTAPLRLGLEKVAIQGKKASDTIEKERVDRITQAIEANARSGAKVYETFRESDQKEWAKKATDKQIAALSEHLDNKAMRTMYEGAKDEKTRDKIVSNIKDSDSQGSAFTRKVFVQTGKEKPPEGATDQEKLKYQQAVIQFVGAMPDKQLRDISKKELDEIHQLRTAVEQLASNRRIARNIANTQEKAEKFSDMTIEAAGLDLTNYKEQLQDPNRDLNAIRTAIVEGLRSNAATERKEHLRALADRIDEDPGYRAAIFNYVPMSSRFVEVPQQQAAAAGGGGGAGGGEGEVAA